LLKASQKCEAFFVLLNNISYLHIMGLPKDTVVVDLNTMPEGWTADKWLHFAKTQGIMLIDSTRGVKPYMLHSRRKMRFMIKEHTDEKITNS